MKILVENVGRSRSSWEMDVPNDPDKAAEKIYREVRKRKCLASRGFEVVIGLDGHGRVQAGFHFVGTIRPIEKEYAKP